MSFLLDESLKHSSQSKQMDLHVRLWEGAEVKTKHIGSEFMGHSSALDIIRILRSQQPVCGWPECERKVHCYVLLCFLIMPWRRV